MGRGATPVARRDFSASSPDLAALVAEKDWSTTLVGPADQWSPALRMMVEHVLGNGFGLLLWWGPQYVQFYNDAYRPVLGTKHPRSLGQPAAECFSEIWHIIGPMIDRPFQGGAPSVVDDLDLEVDRYGYLEETHFRVAYSPVFDETAQGGIGGVIAAVHETTEEVIGQRRIRLLSELSARAAEAKTAEDACRIAADVLATDTRDIPFALFYLLRSDRSASLVAAQGTQACGIVAPETIELGELGFTDAAHAIAASATPDTINTAIAVPISGAKLLEYTGVLIVGTSPRLALTDAYHNFFDLVVAPVATAITNARAHEEERKRSEALAELDRAKNAFFSNVSHEFRTPLALMLGPLTELAKSVDGDAAVLVASAQRNSLRLLKLVNTLLDFSRMEAGRADAAFVETDLAALTRDVCGAFRSVIESAGLEFSVDADLDMRVYVDPDMWEKIVLNLLSNAFKFTTQGAIRVSLTAADTYAELRVADTGIGITQEDLPRVFERFRRARNVNARSHEGSGIGLALTHDLAELHGGTVDVQSQPGVGSVFRVRIPLGSVHLDPERIVDARGRAASSSETAEQYLADVNATIAKTGGARPKRVEPSGARRPRVLLADDNWDLRDYVSRVLSQYYEVDVAAHGLEALTMLRMYPYDLVLSDVMMPEMDGMELLATVREDPSLADVPFVFLSARAGAESAVQGLASGADGYLVKPFSAEELIARTEALLRGVRDRQERYQHQARVARSFQDAALPSGVPNVPGMVFAALYEPADTEDRVGGDFYDAFRLLDGRVVISIGDVAGSGLGAATTMAAIRQSIRAAASINPDPQQLLKAAEGVFLDHRQAPFASVFVAVIDPLTFTMHYANAGHPPPLLRAPSGPIVELAASGLLLGVNDGTGQTMRPVHRLTIEPGSFLILYTDGLTEVEHDPAEGEARVLHAVHDLDATRTAAYDAPRCIRDAAIGADGASSDDVAVLTVFLESPLELAERRAVHSWRFSSAREQDAHRVRGEIRDLLRRAGLTSDHLFSAETVFSELIANAKRHAGGIVDVALDLTQESPVLHMLDRGPGFTLNPKLPAEPYAERGRGLYIMQRLTRECTSTLRDAMRGTHVRAVLAGTIRV